MLQGWEWETQGEGACAVRRGDQGLQVKMERP